MADDKKSIPDAGKVDEPPKPGKVEPVKAGSPVQDQLAPAKAEAPVTEDASKMVKPPAAEQPAPVGKEAPKDKDEKQTTIPGMGDPAPAGKVVDFTAARGGATKGKPSEKATAPDNVRTLTRELVDLLIQNIYIYSSTSIEIVWKCGDEYQRLLADTTKKEAAEHEQG